MILTGGEIERQVELGRITIEPFDRTNCSTNSYDLHIGSRFLRYEDDVLDPYVEPNVEVLDVSDDVLRMSAGDFLLGETVERFGSDYYVPLIHGRSSTARLGLFVHVTADLIDIGWRGRSTLQLFSTLAVRITPGQSIAQVSFWVPEGPIELYTGKYQGADGPMASRSYRDARPD